MKAMMITVRLWWFYLTYKGIKKAEIRKRFAKDFRGKIFECVSKTNWKKDLMKIPEAEREFFKQFVGKVGLCFECDKVEEIKVVDDIDEYNSDFDYHYETESLASEGCIDFTKKSLEGLSCLDFEELDNYLQGEKGKAIHITKLEIFNKPKEISEFKTHLGCNKTINCMFCKYYVFRKCTRHRYLTRAPQSWCYVEM